MKDGTVYTGSSIKAPQGTQHKRSAIKARIWTNETWPRFEGLVVAAPKYLATHSGMVVPGAR